VIDFNLFRVAGSTQGLTMHKNMKQNKIIIGIVIMAYFLVLGCQQATPDKKHIEKNQEAIKINSIPLTIGQRKFNATYEGDFDHFICSALTETLNDLPEDLDFIAKTRSHHLSKVYQIIDIFRLDLFFDKFRNKDLPFLNSENVPVEEFDETWFFQNSTFGRAKVNRKGVISSSVKNEKYKFHIFDEPRAFSSAPDFSTYDEFRNSSDNNLVENITMRRFRLNALYTLYDIKPIHRIESYSTKNLIDWDTNDSPYMDSQYHISQPRITLKYPFKNGEDEVAAGPWPIIFSHRVSDLLRDGEYIYAITYRDYFREASKNVFSMRVTRIDPSKFTTAGDIKRATMLGAANTGTTYSRVALKDISEKPVNICSVKLEWDKH